MLVPASAREITSRKDLRLNGADQIKFPDFGMSSIGSNGRQEKKDLISWGLAAAVPATGIFAAIYAARQGFFTCNKRSEYRRLHR
jgi:hypothetical protein